MHMLKNKKDFLPLKMGINHSPANFCLKIILSLSLIIPMLLGSEAKGQTNYDIVIYGGT
jgi:hypothetical protein